MTIEITCGQGGFGTPGSPSRAADGLSFSVCDVRGGGHLDRPQPFSALSPVQVGVRLSLGFNEREIASTLGVRPKDVEARLEELRAELEAQT